ncbi:hypothetical protein HZA76_01715 [Candidatus Roizmanbacteria bacterium]|nr:hypothetical protein [Candidatus Roizmanbacteria bacterium]
MEHNNQVPSIISSFQLPKQNQSSSKDWLNIILRTFLIVDVIVFAIIIIFLFLKKQLSSNKLTGTSSITPSITISPTLSPLEIRLYAPTLVLPSLTLTPTPILIPSPTPIILKTYTSPVIGDDFYSFQITYPSNWVADEKYNSGESKSLSLTLINENNESIVIAQGKLYVGICVYYDDSDYTSFSGEGQFFSSYSQLSKPSLWRISQNKDDSIQIRTICEKAPDRYVNVTKIGWIGIQFLSSTKEIQSILETIVLKPTATTKTIFD